MADALEELAEMPEPAAHIEHRIVLPDPLREDGECLLLRLLRLPVDAFGSKPALGEHAVVVVDHRRVDVWLGHQVTVPTLRDKRGPPSSQ